MFLKVAVSILSTIALTALAVPTPGNDINNSCNTGTTYCCNSVQAASAGDRSFIASLLGISVKQITGQLGFQCSPLSVIGLGSNSCNASPTCCTGNNYNGLVVVGCTPITINL